MLNNLECLLKLISENPGLPVIPMVDKDVIGEDTNRFVGSNSWMGCIGDAEILMYLERQDGITLYSDCDYFKTLIDSCNYTQENCERFSDDELETAYNSLPWKEAIFVKIIEN